MEDRENTTPEREDEDVEAHRRRLVGAADEPSKDDGDDDVEAHRYTQP